MMVSSKGRYALRVMIYLAQNDREELIPLKEIAENQNISMKYLEMIVSLLHKGNMLISGRGKKGGYRLARKPSEYTIGSILKLTEKTLAPVNCLEGGKVTCEKAGYCITLPMWQHSRQAVPGHLLCDRGRNGQYRRLQPIFHHSVQ